MHAGCPFGGCALLYGKTLSLCVSHLSTSSDRFCAIRVNTCDVQSLLFFSIYMPYENHASSFTSSSMFDDPFFTEEDVIVAIGKLKLVASSLNI